MQRSYLANDKPPSETGRQLDDIHDQLVTCHPDELHPHPSYVRLDLKVPASKLSALADVGDLAFREPLAITREGTILDGYARWQLAQLQGRSTLPCIEYKLTEAEALLWILQSHRRSNGLNDFIRILLALELEPGLKQKARANQRAGGQNKGSSNLTEPDTLEVRREIAAAAGVSTGNVSKVKQLMAAAHPEIVQALRREEISIHKAWLWSKEARETQLEELRFYRSKKGVNKTIKTLVSRHRPASSPTTLSVDDLTRLASAIASAKLGSVSLVVTNTPGRAVFVTEDLFRTLGTQKELALKCASNSR
jgi:hypothetical protein